ncbi:type I-E CRISPR-associated protein Cas6/Cse3/CasE [Streptomyces sp. NPDC127020]|uniref:type I-E CRISPR-associated protein Cas6/Cse3/CasE n=1 Tax=Streptomyces sp. NPDC127020 TaxID=3347109 RepID=UPI0036649DEF
MIAASQAESASSILVTRSIVKAQVRDPGLFRCPLAITRRVHEGSPVVLGSLRPSPADSVPLTIAILRVQTAGTVFLRALPANYARAVVVERISWWETGFEGQRVRFLLDANATKATVTAGQRGKRVGLQTAEVIEWWERQASRAGLATVEVRSRPLGAVIARRLARNPTILQATRLEGLALIADPIALQGAVLSGIGCGRAYGLGLLCLRPADTDVSPVLHS